MARHAGYAAAITATETYLNQMLWFEFQKLEPISSQQLFPLPQVVPLANGSNVNMSGLALFEQRPAMVLAANPDNTITVNASAIAYVTAAVDADPIASEARTWKVRLSAAVQVAIDVDVDAATDGLYLRWIPSGSQVNALTVTELDGADIPDFLIQALNSPQLHSAMNTALQFIGPVRMSGKIFPRALSHTQPADIEETNVSLFEWFVINLAVSSVDVRVLDGCLAVGINVQGFPPGDPNQLVDLNTFWGDSVQYGWRHIDQDSGSSRPLLVAGNVSKAASDINALVNADFTSAIVNSISGQISGTPVFPFPSVSITRVSARPEFFEKPLRGREIAVRVDFTVTVDGSHEVNGVVFVQFFARDDNWRVYLAHAEINVPWWVDAAVILLGVVVSAAIPILSPLVAVGVLAATQGIIPDAVGNIAAKAKSKAMMEQGEPLAGGVITTSVAGPHGEQLTNYKGTKSVHLGTEGIGMTMMDVIPSIRFEEQSATVNVASLATSLDAGSPNPFTFATILRNDLAILAPDCSVQIIVGDPSTGIEIARSEGPYLSNNVLAVDHLADPGIYFTDTFRVRARVFLNRLQMQGLLFAADTIVNVSDHYDRHHPYVTWAEHTAHFRNPHDPTTFWHRNAFPAIHRTASSSRCLALRQRVALYGNSPFGLGVSYLDQLEFDPSEIPTQRRGLCDYCFFGGPEITEPFPIEDWFKR
jgi:hypothetical protein